MATGQYIKMGDAYFQQTDSGLSAVSDQNTLTGLKNGSIASTQSNIGSGTTFANTPTQQPAAIPATNSQPAQQPVQVPPSNQAPYQPAQTDPLMKQYEQQATQAQADIAQGNKNEANILSDIESIFNKQATQSQREAQLEQEKGVLAINKEIEDVISQIRMIDASAYQQTNVQTDRLAPNYIIQGAQERIQRQADSQKYVLIAQAEMLQGRLRGAQQAVDNAIKAEFGGLEARLEYNKTLLDINRDKMNDAQQRLAEAKQIQLEEYGRRLEEQKAEKSQIYQLAMAAAQNNAPAAAIQAALQSGNAYDALDILGQYLGDPNADLQRQLLQSQINSTNALASQRSSAGGGASEQLYSGLSAQTATAVRSKVSKFSTEPIVQNFATIQDGYNFASSISDTTQNPADDQALIYSLAKALDPGSVVREGEYATAQKYAQSWISAYGKGVEQALLGTGFLSEEARRNIKAVIKQKYDSSKIGYDQTVNSYTQGINSLTGRGDGSQFLVDYVTPVQSYQTPQSTYTPGEEDQFTFSSESEPEYKSILQKLGLWN